VVVLADGGDLGVEELRRTLLCFQGLDPGQVPEGWVENHYRLIVWPLTSLERRSGVGQVGLPTGQGGAGTSAPTPASSPAKPRTRVQRENEELVARLVEELRPSDLVGDGTMVFLPKVRPPPDTGTGHSLTISGR
jgi:hypothetical protein